MIATPGVYPKELCDDFGHDNSTLNRIIPNEGKIVAIKHGNVKRSRFGGSLHELVHKVASKWYQ